jgi:peptidoglycan/xylan/chitin deacetylase (PgdA/CDA1 family)
MSELPLTKSLMQFEAIAARFAASALSTVGRGGRGLLIMIYHRVLAAPDPLRSRTVNAREFAAQMDLVASCFNLLPLSEALGRLESRSLPARALSVTFDDGYADNLTVAAPIMRERGIRPTVFVATAYLDGGLMFNDAITEAVRAAPDRMDLNDLGLGLLEMPDVLSRRAAIRRLVGELKYRPADERRALATEIFRRAGATPPRDLMLTTPQLRSLRDAGVEIGAHTATHPILARLSPEAAREDIARSQIVLEGILGDPVSLFAYPNGRPGEDYDARHVAMVRELGFAAALSTSWGATHAGSDRFQLPRVAPWDTSARRYAARLIRSYAQRGAREA